MFLYTRATTLRVPFPTNIIAKEESLTLSTTPERLLVLLVHTSSMDIMFLYLLLPEEEEQYELSPILFFAIIWSNKLLTSNIFSSIAINFLPRRSIITVTCWYCLSLS